VRIEWTALADSDLESIALYIGRDNPRAAVETVLRIIDSVEMHLGENPALGRPGRVPNSRELVIPGTPFIVAYRVRHDALHVLRVLHGSQKWPKKMTANRLG
jgi:toxin ParE1/3/4